MSVAESVTALAEPIVAGMGCSLYDVTVAGTRVAVFVARDGGVDLDTLADITRDLSHALDESDPLPGSYTLEVSSPGLERPLRTPAHFAGAVGSLVTLKTRSDFPGERRIRGAVVEIVDGDVVVQAEASPDRHRIPLTSIESARTVFEWGPAPKPGRKGTGRSQARPADSTPPNPQTDNDEVIS